MSRPRTLLVALPALAILGGCQLLIGLDGGIAGSGGSGGSGGLNASSSSATSSSTTTTTTSSTSSGTGGGRGTGGATSSSSSSTSSGLSCDAGITCAQATECPDPQNECVTRTCDTGCCGTGFVTALTPVSTQTKGNCQKEVCDGSGSLASLVDDTDVPPDQDACNAGGCANGVKKQTPQAATCGFGGGKVCGDPSGAAAGQCVECNTAADCASGQVCAGNRCSALVLMAASNTGTFGATYQQAGTWATPATLGGTSNDEIALAFTTTGTAVGAFRITQGAAASEQVYSTTWSLGTWSAAAAISATMVFTRAAPSISAGSGTAQLAFHGTNFKHYYAAFSGGTWSPLAEQVGGTNQSFGPMPAAIAALGDDAALVFFDGTSGANQPTAQDCTGGTWQTKALMGSDASATSMPSVVAMTGGTADLMAIYARGDGTIVYQTRTGGAWSAALPIGNASTSTAERPALAALPGGQAVMAFRGTDNNLYYAKYDGTAWAGPTAFGTPNVAISATPVLARGIGGAMAEIAFVKTSDGRAHHARLMGNAWSTPAPVGTQAATHVAIASWP
ncbi:MAG: hypothetical protein QM820_59510 [Minicystis sp.]